MDSEVLELAMNILKRIKNRFKSNKYPVYHSFDPEFIELINKAHKELGDEVFDIQGIAEKHMDIAEYTDNFLNSSSAMVDKTVDPNANNSDRSILQYIHSNNKSLMRLNSLYILWEAIRDNFTDKDADECIYKIIDGTLFVNDLHNVLTSYCYAFDLSLLLSEGMSFFKGNIKINPPKRSSSYIDLIIQTTSYISNQITGAIAYPNFFVYLNYFYEKEHGRHYIFSYNKDKELTKEITQQFQNLIYSLNFTFRGTESSFTNLSVLDKEFVKALFSDTVMPDSTMLDDHSMNNIVELAKRFFEYYTHINANEGIFTFPVMTLAASLDKDGKVNDEDFVQWIAETNSEKSLGNIFLSPPNSFSSCCRLINNIEDMYQNSFGVSGVSIGSHRVAGLNIPRIKNIEELGRNTRCVHKILFSHRMIIEKQIARKLLPLYNHDWMFLQKQYSTIGFIGLAEAQPELAKSTLGVINILNNYTKKFKDEDRRERGYNKSMYNVEQIPGESVAVRLAQVDRILGFNTKHELYSNQYIPLDSNVPIETRMKTQGMMDSFTSGGAILHINYREATQMPVEEYRRLIDRAVINKVKYFSINYVFDECVNGHYTRSTTDKCAVCGSDITHRYTRVVGFMTAVENWNKTRREHDFPKRKFYTEKDNSSN